MVTAADVRYLAPGLPEPLIQVLLDAWVETGDFNIALEKMRADPTYDNYFQGNRRDDGTLRHTEAQYLAIFDSYEQTLIGLGVNPAIFHDQIVASISGDRSPLEFAEDAEMLAERILLRSDEVRQEFAAQNGVELTDEALIASALDPDLETGLLERRISIAEVSAEASMRGLQFGLPASRRLVDRGFGRQDAAQLASQAVEFVPLVDSLARRHQDPDDTFDLGEFLEGLAFGDPIQRRRINRLLRSEAASFSQRSGPGRQGAAVTGLEAE